MAKRCQKCNFLNPYGAQVCGECGHPLVTPKPVQQKKKVNHSRGISGISWGSIGLEKAPQEPTSLVIILLASGLFVYGLILLSISIATWFRPTYGFDFIMNPLHLYPLLLGILFGIFSLVLAFGFYSRKSWIVMWYLIWVGLQFVVLVFLMAGFWKPDWFALKAKVILSLVIIIQLLPIPLVRKMKGRTVSH